MPAVMRRRRSRLRWLEHYLWKLAIVGIVFVMIGFVDSCVFSYRSPLPLGYLRFSLWGVLTTAKIDGLEGYVRPRAAYSYTSADGVQRRGKDPRVRGDSRGEALVYYMPEEPDLSTPRVEWFEVQELAIAVLLAAAGGTSLLSRAKRALSPPERNRDGPA
jgi:hypothetical protein